MALSAALGALTLAFPDANHWFAFGLFTDSIIIGSCAAWLSSEFTHRKRLLRALTLIISSVAVLGIGGELGIRDYEAYKQYAIDQNALGVGSPMLSFLVDPNPKIRASRVPKSADGSVIDVMIENDSKKNIYDVNIRLQFDELVNSVRQMTGDPGDPVKISFHPGSTDAEVFLEKSSGTYMEQSLGSVTYAHDIEISIDRLSPDFPTSLAFSSPDAYPPDPNHEWVKQKPPRRMDVYATFMVRHGEKEDEHTVTAVIGDSRAKPSNHEGETLTQYPGFKGPLFVPFKLNDLH